MGARNLLVLALFAGFCTVADAQTRGCNITNFNTCSQTYIGAPLGIPPADLWKYPDLFEDQLANKYTNGSNSLNDIANFCNIFSNFYNCLVDYNENQVERCLGYLGFIDRGVDPLSAYAFDGILSQFLFVCGAGFHMVEDAPILDCVKNTWYNYRDGLRALLYSYQSNITNHNDPNAVCGYAKTLQNGWASIFASGKCTANNRKSAGNFFGCASMFAYTTAQFSHCRHVNTCEFAITYTSFMDYFVMENEDGSVNIRIPPTWMRKEGSGELYLEPEKIMHFPKFD